MAPRAPESDHVEGTSTRATRTREALGVRRRRSMPGRPRRRSRAPAPSAEIRWRVRPRTGATIAGGPCRPSGADGGQAELRRLPPEALEPADRRRVPSGRIRRSTRPDGVAAVDAHRIAEGHASVPREGHVHPRPVPGSGEPRHRDPVARRVHRRPVHRTSGDDPAVPVHRDALGPAALGPPGHVDVAHILRTAVPIDHHHPAGGERRVGLAAVAGARVQQRSRPRRCRPRRPSGERSVISRAGSPPSSSGAYLRPSSQTRPMPAVEGEDVTKPCSVAVPSSWASRGPTTWRPRRSEWATRTS